MCVYGLYYDLCVVLRLEKGIRNIPQPLSPNPTPQHREGAPWEAARRSSRPEVQDLHWHSSVRKWEIQRCDEISENWILFPAFLLLLFLRF